MRNKIIVFLSSAQHEGEFKVEREILPIIFNKKEPLVSIFSLWKIEDEAASITIREQYLLRVRHSQIVILLIGSTVRDAVKEEIEEARRNKIPIYAFIRTTDIKSPEVEVYINNIREFVTTADYFTIDELIEKVEDSLLSIYDIKFPPKDKNIDESIDAVKSFFDFKKIESKTNKPELDKFIYSAVILGSWKDASDGDREVVEEFTGENIDKWMQNIQDIIEYDDKILHFNNGHWKVAKKNDLFFAYSKRFIDSDLIKIKTIASKILTEIDPKFELDPNNRFAAAIYGKTSKYSNVIKHGISEIVALIAVNEDKLINCSDFKPSQVVNDIIYEIFKNADWKLWASLNDLLPILAEASPDQFMTAVENALKKSPCPFDEIYIQGGDGITGWNYMTGMYWALEGLAWSEDYISKSLLLLAELGTHDPGGKWGNNPMNSLVTILLPWLPRTLASFDKQLKSIRNIQKYFPDIAFNVILHLLPNQTLTSMDTHKPLFRNPIDKKWRTKITNTEYFVQSREYAKLAIEMARADKKYLLKLLDYLENITYEELDDLLEYLITNEITKLSDEDRFPIWEKINFTVNKHQKFSDSKWAFDENIIKNLEEIAKKIKPDNPIFLYRYLFSKDSYFYFKENNDWENQIKEIEESKTTALQKIYEYGGIDAIFQFVFSVDDKYQIGFALRSVNDKEVQNTILPEYLDSEDDAKKSIVKGFINGVFSKETDIWIDNFDFSLWNKKQICMLLLNIAYHEKIWYKAEKLLDDYIENFWIKFNESPYALYGDLIFAIDKFLSYGRPLYAAELIYCYYHRKNEFLKDKAISALISGITSNESIRSINNHCLLELITLLQNEKNIDQQKLFKIEWAYLSLLDVHNGGKTVTLHRSLSKEPLFLLEVLKLLYRSENDDKDNNPSSEQNWAAVDNAWHLLERWKTIPGTTDDNAFSESLLADWFSSVKKLCTDEGYLEIAMYRIGKVFYYAPQDTSGLWINKKVAELLDEREHEDLRQGYFNEVINSRGAHFIDETGSVEQGIAELWRKRSQELENSGFVYFAEIAKKIAISYEHEAKNNVSRFRGLGDDKEGKNEEK